MIPPSTANNLLSNMDPYILVRYQQSSRRDRDCFTVVSVPFVQQANPVAVEEAIREGLEIFSPGIMHLARFPSGAPARVATVLQRNDWIGLAYEATNHLPAQALVSSGTVMRPYRYKGKKLGPQASTKPKLGEEEAEDTKLPTDSVVGDESSVTKTRPRGKGKSRKNKGKGKGKGLSKDKDDSETESETQTGKEKQTDNSTSIKLPDQSPDAWWLINPSPEELELRDDRPCDGAFCHRHLDREPNHTRAECIFRTACRCCGQKGHYGDKCPTECTQCGFTGHSADRCYAYGKGFLDNPENHAAERAEEAEEREAVIASRKRTWAWRHMRYLELEAYIDAVERGDDPPPIRPQQCPQDPVVRAKWPTLVVPNPFCSPVDAQMSGTEETAKVPQQ